MPKKQLFTLEYPVRCSPNILYGFLSTPAGLGEWFADKVDERDKVFIFWWNGVIEKAELVDSETDKFIRFRWQTSPKDEYFEFKIEKSEITNQTILTIKDFAEKNEMKDQSQLWEYQVKELFHRLGS
ncbi:MAG: START-like domain-containing protein [Parafilimonas sp.]